MGGKKAGKAAKGGAASRATRPVGAGSGGGKTVSKASLKREAHQAMSLEPARTRGPPTKSPKTSLDGDVHTGLTPHLSAASLDGPSDLDLGSPAVPARGPRTRSQKVSGGGGGGAAAEWQLLALQAGKGKGRGRGKGGGGGSAASAPGCTAGRRRGAAKEPASAAFSHVGAGGTGKRYTGTSAEKAAKKAWRDCKHLTEVTVRGADGQDHVFQSSAWTAPSSAKKFGQQERSGGKGGRRDKGAAFRKAM